MPDNVGVAHGLLARILLGSVCVCVYVRARRVSHSFQYWHQLSSLKWWQTDTLLRGLSVQRPLSVYSGDDISIPTYRVSN